jgi:SecD/SecF fusion protein
LKDFAFALLVGIASGTYSSIFIASPVLTAWKEREAVYVQRRRRVIESFGLVPAFAVATTGGVPAPSHSSGGHIPPASDEIEPDGDARVDEDLEPEEEPVSEEPTLEAAGDDRADELVAGVSEDGHAAEASPEVRRPRPQQEAKKRSRQRRRKHGRRR